MIFERGRLGLTDVLRVMDNAREASGDEGYEKFIRRAGQNPLARKVKIADLKDNMDLSRIQNPTDQDFKRRDKYQRALDSLA